MHTGLRDQYNKVPKSLKIFLAKAFFIFVGWQILYHGYLEKTGFPNHILTKTTAIFTSSALGFFYSHTEVLDDGFKCAILVNGERAVGIADPCNALEIYVLYIAFLVCYPAENKRRMIFAAAGMPLIFLVNIFRCVFITWLNIINSKYVDVAHHYIFTTIVYVLVFYLWVLFSKSKKA